MRFVHFRGVFYMWPFVNIKLRIWTKQTEIKRKSNTITTSVRYTEWAATCLLAAFLLHELFKKTTIKFSQNRQSCIRVALCDGCTLKIHLLNILAGLKIVHILHYVHLKKNAWILNKRLWRENDTTRQMKTNQNHKIFSIHIAAEYWLELASGTRLDSSQIEAKKDDRKTVNIQELSA